MKHIGWRTISGQDGTAIGVDEASRGWEIENGKLTRLPDPPPLDAAERRRVSVSKPRKRNRR